MPVERRVPVGRKARDPVVEPDLQPDIDQYCRDVEIYLRQRNDGHLIRIVGPTFELVRGWAEQGIPINVVRHGIDRYFERSQAKLRRWPVRIDFCELDVLDVFDEWRRATGVGFTRNHEEPRRLSRRPSLPLHLERAIARLTLVRTGQAEEGIRSDAAPLTESVSAVMRELDAMRSNAKSVRGEKRDQIVARLRELDVLLIATARQALSPQQQDALRQQAERELRPFANRMPPAELAEAHQASIDRLVRERYKLPRLTIK